MKKSLVIKGAKYSSTIDGWEVKISMVGQGSGVNIYSFKFLQDLENKGFTIPPMDEPTLCIRGFENVS